MSKVDVSDLLSDPEFVDNVILINRTPRINGKGENTLVDQATNTIGSVQPISGRTMMKVPETMRAENLSSFWLRATIIAVAPGKYSSILVFKGFRFQVRHVYDWSVWGEGFTEGLCVAEVPAPL